MNLNVLEKKWGPLMKTRFGLCNCKLPFISDLAFLNLFFNTVDLEKYNDVFSNMFDSKMPNWLIDFYQISNGIRLFSDSFSIFGLWNGEDPDLSTFDIRVENQHIIRNHNNEIELRKFPIVFFGSLGGNIVFGYDKTDYSISSYDCKHLKKIRDFISFDNLMNHYVEGLVLEYDNDGKKIHVDKKLAAFPSMANTTVDDF